MITKFSNCPCGCGAEEESLHRLVRLRITEMGYIVADTRQCVDRFMLFATVPADVLDDTVQKHLETIKGVRFTWELHKMDDKRVVSIEINI